MGATSFAGLAAAFLLVAAVIPSPSPADSDGGGTTGYGTYTLSRGDTHVHTLNGGGVSTVAEVSDAAKARNLSWIFITDHNVVVPPGACEAETTATFLCLPGDEIDTTGGDATMLGVTTPPPVPGGNVTFDDAMEAAYAQGGLAFVAHPFAESGNNAYLFFGVHDNYTGLEVYHGWAGWNDNPPATQLDFLAVQKWDELLNGGRRVVGVGASDSKNASNTWDGGDLLTRRGAIGFPRNVAYLREFSLRGVLEALERGRLYVTDGPVLEFTVTDAIPGDEVRVAAGTPLAVWLNGSANVSSSVRVVANGSVVYSQAVAAGPFSLSTTFTSTADAWVRAEVRSFNSNLFTGETYLAFANPVYVDVPPFDDPPEPPTGLMAEIAGDDVALTWNASASTDVDHYAVYRADSISTLDFAYPFARPRRTTWRDVGAAGDGQWHYYVVRAVDRRGHEETNTAMAAKLTFPVVEGLNLLSVPVQVANESVAAVLQTVNYTGVWRYEAFDAADAWKALSTAKTLNDLTGLPFAAGFWVNASAAGEFVVAGAVPPNVSIPLRAGWNLVAYASHTPSTVAEALAGVPAARVEVVDASVEPYRTRAATPGETLAPGQALWLVTATDAWWFLSA